MIENIINDFSLFYLFSFVFFVFFCFKNFKSGLTGKKNYLILFTLLSFLLVFNKFFNFKMKAILLILLSLCLLMTAFKPNILHCIKIVFFYWNINLLILYISYNIGKLILELDGQNSLYNIFFTFIIPASVVAIFFKISKVLNYINLVPSDCFNQINVLLIILYTSVFISSISFIYLCIYNNIRYCLLMAIFIVIMNCVLINNFKYSNGLRDKDNIYKDELTFIGASRQENMYIKSMNNEIRYAIDEFKKNVNDRSRINKLREIIKPFYKNFDLGNEVLNAILSEKFLLCENLNIKLKLTGTLDEKVLDKDEIFIAILFELLNEVILLTNKVKLNFDKKISINMYCYDKCFFINIDSVIPNKSFINSEMINSFVTKKEVEHIINLMNSFNGEVNFSYKDNLFTIKSLIPIIG